MRDLSREASFVSSDEDVVKLEQGVAQPAGTRRVGEVFDLAADFSDGNNPNGVWSYERADAAGLLSTHMGNFVLGEKDFPNRNQPGWQASNTAFVPGLAKALDPLANGTSHDLPKGCIFGHGPLLIRWQAPKDGVIDILGSAWMPRDINRPMTLNLVQLAGAGHKPTVFFDNVALPERDADGNGIEEGPNSSRPYSFAQAMAADGRSAGDLLGFSVKVGDELCLSAPNGDFVGLNFTVAYVEREASDQSRASKSATATITVKVGGNVQAVPVEVRKEYLPERVSFKYGALAALSKQGCNQGSCHGSLNGKGGFRLSLRAYDPSFDLESLVREDHGRRINLYEPENSLILHKPLMDLAHGGGQQLRKTDPAYELLRDWIAQGSQPDPPGSPSCVKIEVFPRNRILRLHAFTQQLLVLAHFSDGSVRDVTPLAIYTSSDEAVAKADQAGLVEGSDRGEVAIVVRFLDKLEASHLLFLKDAEGFQWNAPPENNYVDRLVYEKLKQFQILPSDLCTDGQFIRRIYLDVLGILPTVSEVEVFLADQDPRKRDKVIDAVLDRPEYAAYWALKWCDVLRVQKRKLTAPGAYKFHRWIVAALRDNLPYGQFARALLTAQGSTFENPPANYYRAAADTNDCMETTSQLFLGIRMQCAKCHNHPFERWTQDNYYGLAAFFNRVQRKPGNLNDDMVVWLSRGGEMTQPRTGKQVKPWLPLAGEVTLLGEEDRREALVQWLVQPDNPFFARMEVNRIWGHLLGRGIVEPVDDFRDSNPPSIAALLDALAQDFVQHGFDRKHLLRTILKSRTYQLSSRENRFNKMDEKYFSHARARLLSAEQLLDAICQVTGVEEKFSGLPPGFRTTELPSPEVDQEFLKVFGQPERESACQCERSNESSLSQALQLINGPLVQGKLRHEKNRVRKLVAAGKDDAQIIQDLYLVSLCRKPSEAELKDARDHVVTQADRMRGLEDVEWTLLNTKEFLFQH
ncbi:MAG: DUF1553 domain-containing protein [Planctomycetes bacterium]|nr:DUF1553 domain-containing protein [Planctomycetota bacterium]